MSPFLFRVWALVKRVVKSTWQVPALCVAAALAYAAVGVLYAVLGSGSGAWVLAVELVSGLPLLAFLLLAIWLVGSMFLKQTNGKRGLRVLFAVLGGGTALVIGAVTTIFFMFADIDHRADNWRVPEGVALEVPSHFRVEEDAPDIVKRLTGESGNESSRDGTDIIPAEGDFPCRAPNLEQLASRQPDLLDELYLRASCLDKTELLREKAWDISGGMDVCSYTCVACLKREGENAWENNLPIPGSATTYTHPLGNGWELWLAVDRFTAPTKQKERPEAIERLKGYAMQRMDEKFAQLAASPTRETVDTLVPLPACPSIFLSTDDQPGIYRLSLFLPKDAGTDGHYEIRAFEYESGEELDLDRRADTLRLVGDSNRNIAVAELPDRRVVTLRHFMVYTGNWGQFYGSHWEVWFVPTRGEPVKVCAQNFLMQGWMR